jgi:hypothetical protein
MAQSIWGNLLDEPEDEKKKKKQETKPGSVWGNLLEPPSSIASTPTPEEKTRPRKITDYAPDPKTVSKPFKQTLKGALNLLEWLNVLEEGVALSPMMRTASNVIDVARGEGPGTKKLISDIAPIPFAKEQVRSADVLEKLGAGGWLSKAFQSLLPSTDPAGQLFKAAGSVSPELATEVAGVALDIGLDPLTYVSMGLTGVGRAAKLASTGRKIATTSRVGKQIAKFKALGKYADYAPALAERVKLGQSGLQFAGKQVLPKAQAAIVESVAPTLKAAKESRFASLFSTKWGPDEVVRVREIINHELAGRPDLIDKIQREYVQRDKFVADLAKKKGLDKKQVDEVLTFLSETKPPDNAPPYLGIQYAKMEQTLDPTILADFRNDPDVLRFTQEVRDVMTDIADKELKTGVLSHTFETDLLDYLTNLITPEGHRALRKAAGKKTIFRKLGGMINPSAQPRNLVIPTEDISLIPDDLLRQAGVRGVRGGGGGAATAGEKVAAKTTPAPRVPQPNTPSRGLEFLEQGTEVPSRQPTRVYTNHDFKSRTRGASVAVAMSHDAHGGATYNLWLGNMANVAQ